MAENAYRELTQYMYCGLLLLQKKKVYIAGNAQRETDTGFVLWTLLVTEEESLNDWKCLQRMTRNRSMCCALFLLQKKKVYMTGNAYSK
jgi:hypothetical protein